MGGNKKGIEEGTYLDFIETRLFAFFVCIMSLRLIMPIITHNELKNLSSLHFNATNRAI